MEPTTAEEHAQLIKEMANGDFCATCAEDLGPGLGEERNCAECSADSKACGCTFNCSDCRAGKCHCFEVVGDIEGVTNETPQATTA